MCETLARSCGGATPPPQGPSMPDIICPWCQTRLSLPPVAPGKPIRCAGCRTVFTPDAPPPPPPPQYPGGERPSDDPLGFLWDVGDAEIKRRRRRATAPAAWWLGTAGLAYLGLACVYLFHCCCILPELAGGYAPGPVAGTFIGISLSLGLGMRLRAASADLSRSGKVRGSVQMTGVAALVGGGLVSLQGGLMSWVGLSLRTRVGENGFLILMGIALSILATGVCSLIAGVRGLMAPDIR